MNRLFFPARCIACRKILETETYGVCEACLPKLPYAKKTAFSLPFAKECFAPFVYQGTIASALHRLKFARKPPYAKPLADFMAACVPENAEIDWVTFVPVSEKRRVERGFDQSEELAKHIAAALSLPFAKGLVKTTENKRQSALPAFRRAGNVIGVYETAADSEILPNARILLVDDIVTTGATLSEAAKTLCLAGAHSVMGLAAAKTPEKPR